MGPSMRPYSQFDSWKKEKGMVGSDQFGIVVFWV
jgi:hypothetical protein